MSFQEETNMIIEEREELMISINGNQTPFSKKAHFLKPVFSPTNQTLPNPPSSLSYSSKPNFKHLKSKVSLKGRPKPQENWDTWVQNLQITHQNTWKKVGIFYAIKASTYSIRWDKDLIIELAGYWCSETNTFVFSWGECSISLEDIMILGGFSVLGECVETPFENRKIVEFGEKLLQSFMENRKKLGLVGHAEWMSYFMGIGGELEHVAFLILWLSRYVFSTDHYCNISKDVFPIAIALARGTRIALAPAVLASIYRELSLLKGKIVGFYDECVVKELVLWAPFQLVQLWGWERFPTLGPSPINVLDGEPRLSRWRNVETPNRARVMLNFGSLGKNFVWRPYGICVDNWQYPEFYGDEERLVMIDFGVGEELLSFARCLRACELLGLDCIEQYLPHRIGMQFGLDQDVPSFVPRSNETHLVAWNSYDMPLNGLNLYLSPRLLKGDVTARYFDWFKKVLCVSNHSVSILKRQRSHSSHPRVVKFKLSKASDGSMEGNNDKHTPICPTSLSDVPIASSSSKTNVEYYQGMTSQSTNDVPIVESLDFAGSTEDYSKQAPVCLPSSSDGIEPPGFVSNIGIVHNKSTASCSKSSSPDRSYVENLRFISSECRNVLKIKLSSKNLDGNAGQNLGPPPCLAPSCNVSMSSGFFTVHDKSTAAPLNAHVDDSECLLCQSPKKPKIELYQNVEDNSKVVLPCLPSFSNIAIDSGFDDRVWERFIESNPSCETNDINNNSQVDNFEIMPSQGLLLEIEKAFSEMDSQMEQVEKYRDKCLNMSVMRSFDNAEEKHVKTLPFCDKTERVFNDIRIAESDKHGQTDMQIACVDGKNLEGAQPDDEIVTADKKDESMEETEMKIFGPLADDEQDKMATSVNMKSGNGLLGEPVIINDDNDDIADEIEARLSKLERKVYRKQLCRSKSKVK